MHARSYVAIALVVLSICRGSGSPPNILVVLTDDQGWGDLSFHGNTNLSTPNLDQLAKDGAQFERFYVCPVCSPTRAEFLTGRYHPRGGVYSTSAGGERLDLDEKTIADVFKAAGYATGAFGKWHNGMQYPYHPNGRGFDEYYGFCSGHWAHYFSPMLEHNGEIVKGEGFVVDDFTSKAMAFMEASKKEGKPFFAYLPYNTPRSPMQVPDEYWKRHAENPLKMRSREKGKEVVGHTRAALAMCENVGWNVGRLLQKLDDKITWEIEVVEDGEFEVDLYYTCPKADVGSTVELSFKGSSLKTKIAEAFDPPYIGRAADRFKRAEGDEKEWKPMSMGTIRLPKGNGTLTLRATDIPGSSVMDFRLLMFKRKA